MKKHRKHTGGYTTKKSHTTREFKIEHASIAELEARRLEIRRQSAEKHNKRIREEKERAAELTILDSEELSEIPVDVPTVGFEDFVVKRNTFMCLNRTHESANIDALLKIIPFDVSDSDKKYIKIAAGYCRVCKVFYIMKSTYENIKKIGVPECRMCDEKTYLQVKNGGKLRLAHESILMQHGYNVNKIEGLSEQDRRKILALIIDNEVLTKTDIISYLDFFINQRVKIKGMEAAISKWRSDRDFVNEYRIGEYTAYGVSGLLRKEN